MARVINCINQANRFPTYVVYEIYQKIEDFLRQDIHSEEAFKAIDKNKDGFITKGELKLAKKSVGMEQINDVIKQYDLDKGGLI